MAKIIFKINGNQYEVDGQYGPDMSLNDYIRNVADLRGTKVMCHEGGCGACVVSVRAATPPDNEMKTFAVNSCLVSVLSCQDWEVTTAEGIGNRTIGYHDIQSRLAKFNGTQCGYCTPGWIMNMYSLYESKNKKLTMTEIENSFASNMCRCTGYRSIADAFKSFAIDADERLLNKLVDLEDLAIIKPCGVKCAKKCNHKKGEGKDDEWCVFGEPVKEMIVIDSGDHKWYRAGKLAEVFKAMALGDYRLVAGNTGQGVYHVTDYPPNIIDIRNVPELKGYKVDINLILGCGMTLSEMMEVFQKLAASNKEFSYLNQFYDHMDLVAHIPVRNIGTIGGNLCLKNSNNEFQSDLFLLFETVGAMVTIVESGDKTTTITLPQFLKTYMKGKVLLNIMLPPLSKNCFLKTYKIMPRAQNAHAVVNAGFLFKFKPNSQMLESANIVYGGISSTFIHASKTEAVLIGKDPYTDENLQLALKSLSGEIVAEEAPPEPSAAYRKRLAIALYYKGILSLCPEDRIDSKYRSGGEAMKRNTSHGVQTYDTDKTVWPLNQPVPKLEALVQCSGEATFSNDLPTQTNEVFCAFVTADVLAGSIISGFDTSEAFKIRGVTAFYSAKDIPGDNSFTPPSIPFMSAIEEILCLDSVKFYGQPAGIIVADTLKTANKAAKAVKIKYSSLNKNKALVTIEDVFKSPDNKTRVVNSQTIEPTETGNDIKHVIKGKFRVEGQYHYTMEPQTCVVKPTEDGMEVYAATQWMDLTGVAISRSLNVPVNSVNVIVRRLGGGYGGKVTRAAQIACAAALVSHLLGKTARFVLPLETNMRIIGKRMPTYSEFEAAVNEEGEIQYLKNTFYQDCGHSFNETVAPVTALHLVNCYNTKRWYIAANSVTTDTASNTWCRAPSSTEGIAMTEYIMEKIAYDIGKDPLDVKLANMPKDQPVREMIDELKKDSNYDDRLVEINKYNQQNRWRKRGMKLMPMKIDLQYFGNFNSIVSVYHADGSVVVTHGGIEMGQGINTKAAQVCAYTLGIPLEKVSVKPSTSFTSPNGMATGGSIGSECVAFATFKACQVLLTRLQPIKEKLNNAPWEELVVNAYYAGIDLQASSVFSANIGEVTPYEIYGVCALEIEVDILTGNHDIIRVDLLEDVGRSLNPEVDVAQIEGAFVMGIGYWTSEKLVYDPNTGRLLTDRTWTYKPPGIKDIPADMRVYFRRNTRNEFGVLQSKATGEPATNMASVVIHALRAAVRAARLDIGYPDQWLDIDNPCTLENIFMAVDHKIEHYKLK